MRRARVVRAGCVLVAVSALLACTESADSSDSTEPQLVDRPTWGDVFVEAGATGTFALREVGDDATDDTTLVWDGARAAERRLPASTFKILNSMIILETGVVDSVDTIVPWDGVTRDVEAWNRDHSLRSGIEVSAVWMYQALASEVGASRMAEWVGAAGYGNGLTGPRVDEFWLRGDTRISAIEQLEFLERMLSGALPFRPDVVAAVREIIVRETGPGWAWSHKTGTALADEPVLGWLVGTTVFEDRSWVFAMNLDLAEDELSGQIDPQVRQRIARQILESEGALPPDA